MAPAQPKKPSFPIALVAGPLAFALLMLAPLPQIGGVSPGTQARVALGLTAWMAIWWLTQALSLAATSLLPLVILPVAGVVSAQAIAPVYFDDVVALFLGGFCLALAMEKSGLHGRIAFGILRIFGAKPRNLVLGFLVASATLSMWVSNTATTMMLVPIAATVAASLARSKEEGEREWAGFAAACVLAVAFGASIGGVGTLIGTPPNAILKSQYDARFAEQIASGEMPALTFGAWMAVGVPIVLALLPLAWLTLTRIAIKVPRAFEGELARPLSFRADPLPMTGDQRAVMVLFFLTAALWITHAPIDVGSWRVPPTGWDEVFRFGRDTSFISDGTIAMAAAILLFALPNGKGGGDRLLTWDFAKHRLPFGMLLLFGGGLALAKGLSASGADKYLMASLSGLDGVPIWIVILTTAATMTVVSEFASNTAAATMAIPILAGLPFVGTDMMAVLLAGTLGASCGYALPVATPPNMIAIGTGNVSVRQMMRAGLALDLFAIAVVVVFLALLGFKAL